MTQQNIPEHTPQLEKMPPELRSEVKAVGAVVQEPSDEDLAPQKMKIDLHCHTEFSDDCSTPLDLVPFQCQKRNICVQAITDHNTIEGALRLRDLVEESKVAQARSLSIIVGEEVSTSEGEIIGLFLKERIPSGLSPEETVDLIKEQGGMVLIPHGFDPLKRWRLHPVALGRIESDVDVVETFNARVSKPTWNRAAVSWAVERQCLMSAGSDAHRLSDIGSAWVEVKRRDVLTPDDLRRALAGGIPSGIWVHPVWAFLLKLYDRTQRRLAHAFPSAGM